MLDFAHVKALYTTNLNLDIPDEIADRAGDEIEKIVPDDLSDKLSGMDPASPEFEETFRAFFKTPEEPRRAEEPMRRKGLMQPATRIKLEPTDKFRIYQPAPVVSINRYGVVRWNADGGKHRAGDLIPPRNSFKGQTVQFRCNGRPFERIPAQCSRPSVGSRGAGTRKARVSACPYINNLQLAENRAVDE
jgi:hypothetical protein